jgi:3'-phosphoadenosine 5'-phosphosulfate sulfotransferase (PAPS reductase)/FAD synthetase
MGLPEPRLRILSLGAGVQSSTVLLMSCRGELPKLDVAVFADTGWEPQAVYRHLAFLESEGDRYGIPIYRVQAGRIRTDALRSQVRGTKASGHRWASMPYFVLGPNGEKGMIKRQCTKEYKLEPIRKKVRQLTGYAPRKRIPHGFVQQWIGISADEFRRQRGSGEMWRINWHPLIDLHKTRAGCLEWMHTRGYPEPPRSACVGCPFRSDDEWRWLRDNEPASWQDAITFDRAIRNCGGMRGQVFLHAARIPLADVDLRTDVDYGQGLLFDTLCPSCMM